MPTYFIILIGSITPPFFLSFDKKVAFYRRWKYLFPSILITALPFIAWDIIFTRAGIWGFNPIHISGIRIFSLPLEELLFFLVIPYASVFTMDVVDAYFRTGMRAGLTRCISLVLVLFSVLMIVLFTDRIYTLSTFLLLPLLVILNQWIMKSKWLITFYASYLLVLVPFVIVNGLLTGIAIQEEVVWYNSQEIIGLRLGTIPVEDIFYGFDLILMNVTFYKLLQETGSDSEPDPD